MIYLSCLEKPKIQKFRKIQCWAETDENIDMMVINIENQKKRKNRRGSRPGSSDYRGQTQFDWTTCSNSFFHFNFCPFFSLPFFLSLVFSWSCRWRKVPISRQIQIQGLSTNQILESRGPLIRKILDVWKNFVLGPTLLVHLSFFPRHFFFVHFQFNLFPYHDLVELWGKYW